MINEILSVEQSTCNTAPAPAIKWEFDLTNQQHVDMRRLMADVYQRHSTALTNEYESSSSYCRGYAYGLYRFARCVLKDTTLTVLCADLVEAVQVQSKLHSGLRG